MYKKNQLTVMLSILGLFLWTGCQHNGPDGEMRGTDGERADSDVRVPSDVPPGETPRWDYQWEGPWGAPDYWSQTDSDEGEIREPAVHPVNVELTEYAIEMPGELSPGMTKLIIANAGTVAHGLVIQGPGVQQDLGRELGPGETAVLQLNLPPGAYRVWCPVDGHAAEGMSRELVVRQP